MKELSLHLLDIAQNSIAAGAHHVDLGVEERGEMLWLTVADDGRGMSPEFLASVTDLPPSGGYRLHCISAGPGPA